MEDVSSSGGAAAIAQLSSRLSTDLAAPTRSRLIIDAALDVDGRPHPCALFDDAFVVVTAPSGLRKSGSILHSVPLCGSSVRDTRVAPSQPSSAADKTRSRSRSGSRATPRYSWELTTPTGARHVCAAASQADKREWMAHLTAALADAASPDQKLELGWMHALVSGTLFSAALAGDVDAIHTLAPPRGGGGAPTGIDDDDDADADTDGEPLSDLDAVDEAGYTALHYAVLRGHAGAVEALLEAGAQCNVVDADFNTPLHIAAAVAHDDIATILIANEASLDMRNLLEQTPLTAALTSDSADSEAIARIVEALLAYGADADEADIEGLRPLHHAALRRLSRLVAPIARHGGDVNALADLDPEHAASVSALHIAVGCPLPPALLARNHDAAAASDDDSGGHYENAEGVAMPREADLDTLVALCRAGAQPNGRAAPGGETPLHVVLRGMRALKSAHFTPPDGPAAAVARERYATALACCMRLAVYGARLDVKDGAGIPATDLAAELGLTPPLELGVAEFRGLQPPPDAATAASVLALRHAARARTSGSSSSSSVGPRSPPSPRPTSASKLSLGLLGKLQHMGRGVKAASWTPDGAAGGCTICGGLFSLASRRHHCRACGSLVCGACSGKVFPFADADGGADSDDDEAAAVVGGGTAAGRGKGSPASPFSSFTAVMRSALATPAATAAGGSMAGAGAAPASPPPTSSASTAASSSRVCDGCFNALCSRATEVRAERADVAAALAVAAGASAAATGGKKPISFDTFAGGKSTGGRSQPPPQPPQSQSSSQSAGAGSARAPLLGGRPGRGAPAGAAGAGGGGAGTGSAARSNEGVKAALADAKEKLGRRGEKISHLGERTKEMAETASEFAELSSKLKNAYTHGFFGF